MKNEPKKDESPFRRETRAYESLKETIEDNLFKNVCENISLWINKEGVNICVDDHETGEIKHRLLAQDWPTFFGNFFTFQYFLDTSESHRFIKYFHIKLGDILEDIEKGEYHNIQEKSKEWDFSILEDKDAVSHASHDKLDEDDPIVALNKLLGEF